jgi:hypothetical protein
VRIRAHEWCQVFRVPRRAGHGKFMAELCRQPRAVQAYGETTEDAIANLAGKLNAEG